MAVAIHNRLIDRLLQKRRGMLAARLLGYPAKVLGTGAHATAFLCGKRQALKVIDKRDLSALWFARFSRRQFNPHFPRFFHIQQTHTHVIVWMERLYDIHKSKSALQIVEAADSLIVETRHHSLETLISFAEIEQTDEPWQRCPPLLRKPLIQCMQQGLSAGFVRDNKRTAWMRRPGNVIVLIDPFLVPDSRRKLGGVAEL
jgi:hypothetical protein